MCTHMESFTFIYEVVAIAFLYNYARMREHLLADTKAVVLLYCIKHINHLIGLVHPHL